LGIKHVQTSACHPAANGVAERLVGSFKSMLERHVNSHPIHWVQSVPVMRQQYWARVHTTLGISPQEMVFGRQPVPVLPLVRDVLAVAASAEVWVWPESADCEYPALHAAQLRQRMAAVDQEVFARIKQQFSAMHVRGPCVGLATPLTALLLSRRAILCWRWFRVLWRTWVMVFEALSVCWKCVTMVWFCLVPAALVSVRRLRVRATSATLRGIWTIALCVLLWQRPKFGGLQATCAQRW
jgi:hypothetical protein